MGRAALWLEVKMKKVLLASALTLSAASAFAADLPSRKEAPVYMPPAPMATWTGFYAGLNVGGGWSANSGYDNGLPYADPRFAAGPGNFFLLPNGGNGSNAAGGVVGGGQVGYNYQFQSLLVGVEADIQGTSITNSGGNGFYPYPSPLAPAGGLLIPLAAGNGGNVGLPWFGTVRGRVGYLITPTLLLYGTGGFAYGGVEFGQWTNTRTGWTAGGGVEWMFMPNWSAKVEYLFTDLSDGGRGGAWGWGNANRPQFNVVRAGVNYHFNWGAPAPVVAKY
jgi:outer membrane immunogenic protein